MQILLNPISVNLSFSKHTNMKSKREDQEKLVVLLQQTVYSWLSRSSITDYQAILYFLPKYMPHLTEGHILWRQEIKIIKIKSWHDIKNHKIVAVTHPLEAEVTNSCTLLIVLLQRAHDQYILLKFLQRIPEERYEDHLQLSDVTLLTVSCFWDKTTFWESY